ncbi:TPA: hypothetical protein DEB00_01825 [Candidatus Uhrbacteria bacterium]|nr:hypothetical protein [Candidatus Uhrbacteria bacterium]
MSFIDKVKSALNIGGCKLTINGPGTVQNGANLDFSVMLIGGKMDQQIKDVQVQLLMMETSRSNQLGVQMGNNSSQNVQTVTLAQQSVTEPFTIHPGEQKQFSFSLPVQIVGDAANQAGMLGALNKLDSMVHKQQRTYTLMAVADIEGSTNATASMNMSILM